MNEEAIEFNNLVNIVSIKQLESMPDYDNIELARMEENDWQCVVKKGEFKPGDLGVYFCIDSMVDKTNPELAFMERKKFIVWNTKFRGTPSQGLLLPISFLKSCGVEDASQFKPGDDVTVLTKTVKYEKPVTEKMASSGNFPSHLISITDESNAASYKKLWDELVPGEILDITEKADGSSATVLYEGGKFTTCSRRLITESGYPNLMAEKYNFESILAIQQHYAVQMECVGPGIQKNKLGLTDKEVRVFNIKNLQTGAYLNYIDLQAFCNQYHVPPVRLVETIEYNPQVHTFKWFQELANNLKYENGHIAEGIVIRPRNMRYSRTLRKMWSLKVINQNYGM